MRRWVLVVSAALVCLPVYLKSRRIDVPTSPAAFAVLPSGRSVIKVSGDVPHPGVYRVCAKNMAVDAINMAGLATTDLQCLPVLNSLASLSDGTALSLHRERNGSYLVTVANIPVPERLVLGIPLDISLMNEADFDRLPGVGPALAHRIAEYRQNNGGNMRAEDLMSVEGIGEKKYANLKKYFQHP